jgi:hypothetical protein
MSEPKEFWIMSGWKHSPYISEEEKSGFTHHTIEYSAYRSMELDFKEQFRLYNEVVKERDEARAHYEQVNEQRVRFAQRIHDLETKSTAERAKAQRLVEALKLAEDAIKFWGEKQDPIGVSEILGKMDELSGAKDTHVESTSGGALDSKSGSEGSTPSDSATSAFQIIMRFENKFETDKFLLWLEGHYWFKIDRNKYIVEMDTHTKAGDE